MAVVRDSLVTVYCVSTPSTFWYCLPVDVTYKIPLPTYKGRGVIIPSSCNHIGYAPAVLYPLAFTGVHLNLVHVTLTGIS